MPKVLFIFSMLIPFLLSHPNQLPSGGINPAGVCYWSTEIAFTNVFPMGKEWISVPINRRNKPTRWKDDKKIAIGVNGYPSSLLPGQAAKAMIFTHNGGKYPLGEYVLTWEGEGTVSLDAKGYLISKGINRKVYRVTATENKGILVYIFKTNPNNPVHNIRLWLPGFENSSEAFYPGFKKDLQSFQVLRFLDWIHTNNSKVVNWEDRPHLSCFYRRGVPYEVMIQLCNELQKDIWITIPHLASDDYVEKLANLVNKELNPSLKVWIEYSNEVWNGAFGQHYWVKKNLAQPQGIPTPMAYGKKSAQMFDLFSQYFPSSRTFRVIAGQAKNPWILKKALQGADGKCDVAAVSWYFTSKETEEYVAANLKTTSYEKVFSRIDQDISDIQKKWRENYLIAKASGVPLVSYEGGQHLISRGKYKNNKDVEDFLKNVNRHPLMYNAYQKALNAWRAAGGTTAVFFSSTSQWTRGGALAFGHLEYTGQPHSEAPKYKAAIDWLSEKPQTIEYNR